MFSVSDRKIIFVLFLGLISLAGSLQAQRMHHFDTRKVNLGFTMGLSYGGYYMTAQVDQRENRQNNPRFLRSVEMVRKPGIYLGLITNFKITNNFDLRFLPAVSLEERDFLFHFDPETMPNGESVISKKIESSNLNLPLLIKFKSNYYKFTRVYVQFGLQPTINLASTKKVANDPVLLKTEKFDLAYVASVGIDLYGEKLKLSPELRFSRGLRNVYVSENTEFGRAISDLFSQLLTININFE